MDGLSSFFFQRNVKGVWPARMARHLPCPAAPHSPAQAARREGSTVERALPLHGQSPALPLPPGRNGWRFVSAAAIWFALTNAPALPIIMLSQMIC